MLESKLAALQKADTDDFLELVRVAKLNPSRDFIGADLTKMNFRGLDLTDFDFSGADFRLSELTGARMRSDKCLGTFFGVSKPQFLNRDGDSLREQSEFSFFSDRDEAGSSNQVVFDALVRYFAERLAFDRMGLVIRFTQNAPNVAEIQRFAKLALQREKSSWCRKLLVTLVGDLGGWSRSLIEAQTLSAAVGAVHSLRRHELIYSIEDHAERTPSLIAFASDLRRRSRSEKIIQAIDRILLNPVDER